MSEPEEMDSRFRGNDEKAGPGSDAGMMKKQPCWVTPFLRALERTGDVRASAEDAGIDHSTAYLRRRTHPGFASNWEWVLQAHAERIEREKVAELASLTPPPASPVPLPTGFAGREELTHSASQLKRAGHDRWSARKEKLFFDELAATANVKRSAKAAGVSPNAVYQRRMRDRHFKAKWAAVLETGRAAIEMHLVEAANRAFDPDELDTGEVQPKVSVAEAIKITQSGPKSQGAASDFEDDPNYDYHGEIDDIRENIIRKLRLMKHRDRVEQLKRGWSYDESWDIDIPPGWAKTADWRPMEDSDRIY